MKKIYVLLSALAVIAGCDKVNVVPAEPATIAKSLEIVFPEGEAAKIYTDANGSVVFPMVKGESLKFSYNITPDASLLTFPEVEFVTTDASVVSVTSDGSTKAISAGNATVSVQTVTVNTGVTASILVKVSENLMSAQSITVTDNAENVDEETGLNKIYVGETVQLSATITPEEATYKTVSWSSNNPDIATVDAITGIATGVSKGKVTFVATALDGSGVKTEHEFYIDAIIEPNGIKITNLPSASDLYSVLDTYIPVVEYEPALATKSHVKWTSSDENVATVSEKGVVTFGCPGKVTITATCENPQQSPSAGFQSSVSLSFDIPFGYYNDHCMNCWWKPDTNGATIEEKFNESTGENYLLVTPAASGSNWRGDFKFYPPKSVQELSSDANNYTFLSRSAYPIVCFRLDDINDSEVYPGAKRSIFIDTNNGYVKDSGSTTKIWSGRIGGGGANKWASKYKCSDGSSIIVYDISTQSWQNGGMLDETGICVFNHLKIGYADISQAQLPNQSDAAYRFFWFHTFKSAQELNEFLSNWTAKTGITYE